MTTLDNLTRNCRPAVPTRYRRFMDLMANTDTGEIRNATARAAESGNKVFLARINGYQGSVVTLVVPVGYGEVSGDFVQGEELLICRPCSFMGALFFQALGLSF